MSRRLLPAAAALAVGLAGCGTSGDGGDDGDGGVSAGQVDVVAQEALRPWFSAAGASAEQPAEMVVLGDSVSEGSGLTGRLERRWLDQLQHGLRERVAPGCPTGAAGWHGTSSSVPPDYRATSLPDPATTGDVAEAPGLGPGGRALTLRPGATLTWTVDARQVDVGYRTVPGGGRLQVRVDGSPATRAGGLATTTAASTEQGRREVWSSADLGAGEHRVQVRNVSAAGGGPVTVTDLRPYRDDRERCVHVLDAARSGVRLHEVVRSPSYLDDSLGADPELVLVPLGFNDAGAGTDPATFADDVDTLVRQVRQRGIDAPVLLVGLFHPPEGAFAHPWEEYLAAMAEAASVDRGVAYVDLSEALPTVDDAAEGIYRDALHPAPAGMDLIAEALLPVLTPPEGTATTSGTRSPS